ncbi:Rieske 2Fe-2S domain-containing protein [Maribrevibacterium harenarium]|uniref:Rieske 2Fe-2S domain-containing protein n=1 Tax=Maribrevibacterium harenarium TaxID=2589817 RepID=A0A501W3V2_9GAMM|nr:Rieske 2Fe-2S domain-containing protein [Maribrevibacterium harenarium]TPE44593.1 Rieske 2Fe-2S domain-containing protein [Maribrevibacterium harenarium]
MSWICTDINVNEIEETGRGFYLNDTEYVCIPVAGEYHVYINACPHFGSRLEWMPNYFLDGKRQYIQCSRHEALFEKHTGLCIQGPCEKESLSKVAAEVRAGVLWIKLDD